MRHLRALGRQGLVVELARRLGVQSEVELVLPAELEPGLRQRVVPETRARVSLGEIRRVRRDLVGDDAVFHVLLVRQAQVLLGRHVAEHRRAEPSDHGRADRRRDVVVARRDIGHEGAEGVEGRLVADRELLLDVLLDPVHRDVARPFDHDLAVLRPGLRRQLAQRLELRELRRVVGVGRRARAETVPEREGDVVRLQDLADLVEPGVKETFQVMREAPLGHDRAAARDDPRHASRGQRDVGEPDAGVHREVVDALLGLLDQRVAIDLPGQLLGLSADLLERLIDRDGSDRNRGVPKDPLPGLVDVAAGREVHDRIGAPSRRPGHLLDLLLDRRAHGGVADVGVDLHEEVASDDHRLGLGVIDVGRQDRAAARDLAPNLLGLARLAHGDEFHLGRHLAPPRVEHLRDRAAPPAGPRRPRQRELGGAAPDRIALGVRPARVDPLPPQFRKAAAQVDVHVGVGVGPGRVVDAQRRVELRFALASLASVGA